MNMQQPVANNYMLIDIGIGRADLMKHSAVASDAAASECKVSGNVPVRTRVGSLGSLTTGFKQVNSKFAVVRTWLYDNTLPFTDVEEGQQKRGKRIVPVNKVPEVLTKLAELKADAFGALDAFMPDYRAYHLHATVPTLAASLTLTCPTPTCSPVSTASRSERLSPCRCLMLTS